MTKLPDEVLEAMASAIRVRMRRDGHHGQFLHGASTRPAEAAIQALAAHGYAVVSVARLAGLADHADHANATAQDILHEAYQASAEQEQSE